LGRATNELAAHRRASVRNLPHDVSDLYLAPVVLAIDAKLDELGTLEPRALAQRVAIESNALAWSRDDREKGLLVAIQHFIDCRGWTMTWDPRGLRLSHAEHTVVLGVPGNFADYVSGAEVSV
jgi:hypothetical protein